MIKRKDVEVVMSNFEAYLRIFHESNGQNRTYWGNQFHGADETGSLLNTRQALGQPVQQKP
jgi:hypothetical protein